MTRSMRSAAIAALAAIAAVAAIIAADLTPPASAQSEDETTGRIVARLLEDGRVEFGWQPSGGSRVLPEKRYFPASIDHNRWLRSSTVEVDGAEIGRINARLSEDGRIEFAFTPTDGERIQPQARYFPADAQAGRWLRSTEIAIGPARAGYIAVSAGSGHTCAIRASDSAIECWGDNDDGKTDAPDGGYTAVSAGWWHTCAIRASGEIECWGHDEYGETDAPDGGYTAVSAGDWHTCAIRESGEIECWGHNEYGQSDAPEGSHTAVSAGSGHTCAILTSGEIECWGRNDDGQSDAPEGSFIAVSAGHRYTCAIRASDREIACWGESNTVTVMGDVFETGKTDAPEGEFRAVNAGLGGYTCAIRESEGAIECWGLTGYFASYEETGWETQLIDDGRTDAPEGSYTAVSAGFAHTCAIRASDGAIECWGDNDDGQATPPTD